MGQGGGIISISAVEKAEYERRGQEPGACPPRERGLVFDRAGLRLFLELPDAGEMIPTSGGGEGFTAPCSRTDCEWVDDNGKLDTPEGFRRGSPCPRWLRLATTNRGT